MKPQIIQEYNSNRFSGYKPQSNTSLVHENNVINHPFTPLKIKAAIKLLINNKACRVDNIHLRSVYLCFVQAKTLCRYGCMYFLAALVLVCVDVIVMSSA